MQCLGLPTQSSSKPLLRTCRWEGEFQNGLDFFIPHQGKDAVKVMNAIPAKYFQWSGRIGSNEIAKHITNLLPISHVASPLLKKCQMPLFLVSR